MFVVNRKYTNTEVAAAYSKSKESDGAPWKTVLRPAERSLNTRCDSVSYLFRVALSKKSIQLGCSLFSKHVFWPWDGLALDTTFSDSTFIDGTSTAKHLRQTSGALLRREEFGFAIRKFAPEMLDVTEKISQLQQPSTGASFASGSVSVPQVTVSIPSSINSWLRVKHEVRNTGTPQSMPSAWLALEDEDSFTGDPASFEVKCKTGSTTARLLFHHAQYISSSWLQTVMLSGLQSQVVSLSIVLLPSVLSPIWQVVQKKILRDKFSADEISSQQLTHWSGGFIQNGRTLQDKKKRD